ncbi:haloacid dehalogenase-like hydrolase [Hymenobacter sp. BT18]|uniref:HAD family hydrolase n=1 Tax=Hymenobacter sp. BT18 TaxID=2835648 RepID=UPI00143E1FAA|nr:HAD family hydrolase [Hymenobacter sp. BT18]QIX62522.1 haloacid dehalogenase-like hydrolase [Hymenobacter sp. BT18]
MLPTAPAPHADVFVFDVCDTLFYSNTTFDYLEFVLRAQKRGGAQRWLTLLTKRWSPAFVGLAVLQKLRGGDPIKTVALRLLRGIPKAELYRLGQQFVQEYLSTRKIAHTHTLLAGVAGVGTRVILLSASLDPIVAAIAAELKVEFVSSLLGYDVQGQCTGELVRELGGDKPRALQELLGPNAPVGRLAVATDNFTDHGLVSSAACRYVVVHKPEAKGFWQDLQPEFIEAYSA